MYTRWNFIITNYRSTLWRHSFSFLQIIPKLPLFLSLEKRLSELSDIYIDNYGPPGDALVEITEGIKVSAFSTIAGSFILNSIIAETAKLAINDDPFPFYISSNMPKSKEHNEKLLKKYRARNPHL